MVVRGGGVDGTCVSAKDQCRGWLVRSGCWNRILECETDLWGFNDARKDFYLKNYE